MADIIQLLPDHVANQIAAGEVVQRPASVVKELLENAIDAKAARIQLLIKDAGKTLIQVIDDGIGMTMTDARLSFERHATSKIRQAEDLFDLHTKGFRGEALASIAAIAHVELKTRQEAEDVGHKIEVEGSHVVTQDIVVTPKGTSVAVKNLFYNIPARRNFLKSNPVETRHIIDEFHRVALAHPDIAFSLHHNENELFTLPSSNYRQRIVNIFGNKTNEKLVPVEETTEIITISGFIIKPEFAKKTRGEQFFFVNDRFIKSSYLHHAVNAAFEGLLRQGTHASYFLNLQVDPKTIDINIHPTKTEIKFDDEHSLYAILRSSVKHSLGQFNIVPALDFERDANLDTPYGFKEKQATTPIIEVDRSFNPFSESSTPNKTGSGSFKKEHTADWESLYVGLQNGNDAQFETSSHMEFESAIETPQLFDEEAVSKVTTFQLQNKYIINTVKSGMLIIDQHRAHQRILYEQLLQDLTVKEATSQQLLFPLQLEFSSAEIAILQEIRPQLERTGFMFDSLQDTTAAITGIPISAKEEQISVLLEMLIQDVQNEVPDSHFSQTDMLAKSIAKGLAIKAGNYLSQPEQEHLLNSLFACKDPNTTPTGLKTFTIFSVDDIQKKF